MSVEVLVRDIDGIVLGRVEPSSVSWLHDLDPTSALTFSWPVEFSEADHWLTLFDLDLGWRVADLRVRGEPVHSYLVTEVAVNRDDDGGLRWEVSGVGVEQFLSGLPILPEVIDEADQGGFAPVDERIFGPGSYADFDDLVNWTQAQVIVTVRDACDPGNVLGRTYKCASTNAFDRPYPRNGRFAVTERLLKDDPYTSDEEAEARDGEYPDLDAAWLAPASMDLPGGTTVPPGRWWLRRDFTLTSGTDFVILATADEHYVLYVDGVEIGATHGDVYQWRSWQAYEIGLPAGDHVIAARIDVVQRPAGDEFVDSSTGFLMSMWEVDGAEPPERLDTLTPFLRTDTSTAWQSADVGQDTGWTPGEVLRALREMAQAASEGDATPPPSLEFVPTFTDALDSAGEVWGVLVDFALNVTRSGGLEAVRKLGESGVDVAIDFPNRTLEAFNERGADRTEGPVQVELTVDRDVLRAGWRQFAPSVNSVKTRFRYGSIIVDDPAAVAIFGRVWAPLAVGDALDRRQARAIGLKPLAEAARALQVMPVGLVDPTIGWDGSHDTLAPLQTEADETLLTESGEPILVEDPLRTGVGDTVWFRDRSGGRLKVRVLAIAGSMGSDLQVSWEAEVEPL